MKKRKSFIFPFLLMAIIFLGPGVMFLLSDHEMNLSSDQTMDYKEFQETKVGLPKIEAYFRYVKGLILQSGKEFQEMQERMAKNREAREIQKKETAEIKRRVREQTRAAERQQKELQDETARVLRDNESAQKQAEALQRDQKRFLKNQMRSLQ
ncbi:MAG TPA: hypothetical protein DD723_07250 [Candidatus Omnitrophica bacterium]|nr:MAG: hypothetical protein A2Z81_09160 [Omnitrophica WOR_2 bacterium GWA2_45_18]HBR15321.1 hypothetical protein [Candidatus Omnitrophota bacterium]